ncbi:hypothetical protein CDD83_4984 [Cordyceps sp. RAO-2017]|nr:hypothetical protein CDD83_4984 [Cordyceps sp. RAO-2017]
MKRVKHKKYGSVADTVSSVENVVHRPALPPRPAARPRQGLPLRLGPGPFDRARVVVHSHHPPRLAPPPDRVTLSSRVYRARLAQSAFPFPAPRQKHDENRRRLKFPILPLSAAAPQPPAFSQ